MKFGRYLQDTQTPEWKKAYIDYSGLKKLIKAIRSSHEGERHCPLTGSRSQHLLSVPNKHVSTTQTVNSLSSTIQVTSGASSLLEKDPPKGLDAVVAPTLILFPSDFGPTHPPTTHHEDRCDCNLCKPSLRHNVVSGFRKSWHARRKSATLMNLPPQINPQNSVPLPLHRLLPLLSSIELSFFAALNTELDKIEGFYLGREKEMQSRSKKLETQLKELGDHGRFVDETRPKVANAPPIVRTSSLYLNLKRGLSKSKHHGDDDQEGEEKFNAEIKANVKAFHQELKFKRRGNTTPVDYVYARRKLKKAVFEHYRGLEVLNNYRILNLTGFRKALKKFEKVTKIPAQDAYMQEKVAQTAFFSDRSVCAMMEAMEVLFASSFERGDRKKARNHLCASSQIKSHYFSMFSSGIFIGLAVPAFFCGLYQSFQPDTRAAIPEWDSLLFIYAIFLVPVLFALLVGVNLLVYSQARINYVFIFELDLRTRLDYREYVQTPAIILAALSLAFWLSFNRIGAPSVSPTAWPLVWLGFTSLIMFNPLPVMSKPSRWWLIRHVAKLLISGTHRVEFTDFWMGDQFCSLIFTLSNLPFVVCAYVEHFDNSLARCMSSSRLWPVQFVLAALPLFVRVAQSVKRYADSKMLTHLINAGKYGVGIVSYFFYFHWRHQGSQIQGAGFALYCIFMTASSLYGSAWDFLMDWSVFQRRAKYPMLRSDLVYSGYIPVYYIAIASNILIRFCWILYILQGGPNHPIKSFIMGILEMLRRWQWNFYRLENEHLGNVDQYRVTREVPLPYSFGHEDEVQLDFSPTPQVKLGRYRAYPGPSFLSFS